MIDDEDSMSIQGQTAKDDNSKKNGINNYVMGIEKIYRTFRILFRERASQIKMESPE